MKNIRKGPIVYGGVVRGRKKFLIINIILTALYILYMMRAMPFIVGKLHGPYDFDLQHFIANSDEITITEEIKMKKRADKSIPSIAYADLSYFNGDKYRFNVKLDKISDIGVKYTQEIEDPKTKEVKEYVLYTVYMGKIGDKSIPIITFGENMPNINNPLIGIFVQPAEVIKADISKLTINGSPVIMSEYMLDCRNLEMETEGIDIFVMWFGIILLAFLYIRVLRYYINPYLHPTYKQLFKYGELENVVNDIEDQFETGDVYTEDKELISVDWIMTKDTFKNKIVKNHRTRGRYS